MSDNPITEQMLINLGFKDDDHYWVNQSFLAAGWPTRITIVSGYAIIEQAEYTGEKSEGTGDSDWDWTKASDICLKCQTESQLLKIIEVLKA